MADGGDVLTGGTIESRLLEEEMRSSYLDYAMSVIVGRALPDVRDGLKPVHRRVLYAMNEAGLQPNRAYAKCARIVGEVMGNFHPHGDQAIYDTLVRTAGTPPFKVQLGDQTDEALSFEDLRRAVLDVAKEGVQLQRFKGLGEMNPDQLYSTTMDPSRRTLQRVTIEDASAADQVFSMLMGDKVEPRREFIEENARVATLDV